MPPYQPNAELAMTGWLKSVPGVDPLKVGPTKPSDPKTWASTGFVTCTTVGGSPGIYVPMRNPVLSIDVWRVLLNSEKAPWGEAMAQAEHIFNAFFDPTLFPLTVANTGFLLTMVHTGYPLREPRKVSGSAAGYAHVQFDAALHWTAVDAA